MTARMQEGLRVVPLGSRRGNAGIVEKTGGGQYRARRVGHFEAVLNLKTPMCRKDVCSSKTGNDLETLVRTGETGMCAIEGGMQADEESWMCSD